MKKPPAFELYDLQSDPHEFKNLAEDPARQAQQNDDVIDLAQSPEEHALNRGFVESPRDSIVDDFDAGEIS